MRTVPDTDVLIVGAGPVGLFLANECARRGLRWRLLEARPGQSSYSKALAIFSRTLEIFDMAGLSAPFLEAANRVTSVAVVSHGRTLAHMRFAPEESPYPFIAMVPQNVTERLLAAELQRRGGIVEYNTAFLTAVQDDDQVTAVVEQDGRRRQITASFLVGCDGAHSPVRHLLRLPFDGAQYDTLFMLADIETNDALPSDELQLCPSEFGPVAIFPMSATRRRVVATVGRAEGEAPSLDLVRAILAARAPRGIEVRGLHWSSYFHVHHRQVKQMRVGRMFIAGDAAHIHSPYGGQGMNTGLHDAWNLAWKLDLVVHGRGGEMLLDSYTAERRPVIRHVIETTHLLTMAMGTPSRLVQALRDAVIPMVSHIAPFQHAFVERLSELGVLYRGSPIVDGDGQRYFDESLRGGRGIVSRFLLMVGRDVEAPLRKSAEAIARELPEVIELRARPGRDITLVRPDGYVAYSAHSRVGAGALKIVRTLLEQQTRSDDRLATAAP
ncbi:MAG TPA: FAD-dependent monooxygenase [Vicinamibacterales bacterium]|nr:FAD-dependent monooxygenase [Vicinamibacterales bacterium]